LLLNALIIGLWLWLYRPLFSYLAIIFSDQFFRTNQLILFAVLGLVLLQIRQGGLSLQLDARPQLLWLPLGLTLIGSLLYLLFERFLDMNIVASSLFFLASYGLLGLWMAPVRWRQGLPAALLLIGALPFGDHMQTFVGYPMRIATAHLVGDSFRALGVGSIGLDTILTFENGIAHVDLPCSGVKSLWTGGLFLIAVTWLERHPLNLRWLWIAGLFGGLLFVGNFIRVAVLIGVGVVGQMALLAEVMHVPLGVLSFGVACGVALWLVRWRVRTEAERVPSGREASATTSRPQDTCEASAHFQPIWLSPTLVVCIGMMALLYQPRPQSGLTAPPPAWSFPPEITTSVEPLTADETWWLTKDGAESADRRRFQWGDVSGSMLLITSYTWRAHHRPERCFEVKGLSVDDLRTHLVAPELPIRVVALGQGDERNTHSAVYWFQSAELITEDYGTRMWADVAPQRTRWVLVAILFDAAHPPDSTELAPFYQAMAATVADGLP
jgi:exosortase O